jgi:hypothetical protein
MEKISVISSTIEYISQYRLLKKQIELFNKHMAEEHDFFCVVGQTSNNQNEVEKILEETKKDNIKTKITPLCDYSVSNRASFRLENAIKQLHTNKHFKCFCVHLDVFPIKNFSMKELINNFSLAGVIQYRPFSLKSLAEFEDTSKYLWENFLFVNTKIIDPSEIDLKPKNLPKGPADCGAGTSALLEKYDTKILGSHERILQNCCVYLSDKSEIDKINLDTRTKNILNEITDLRKKQSPFHAPELFIEDIFYHFRSLTGWHLGGNSKDNEITNQCIDLIMEL